MNMNQKEYIRLLAVLVIGLIIGYAAHTLMNRSSDPVDESAETEGITIDQAPLATQDTVIVKNQLAGNTVVVESATLNAVGWVAIHDNTNGVPGKILGAALFDKGQHAGTVSLLRATVAGKSYFAVLHKDDGDFKNFNAKTDTILMNGNTPNMVQFTVSANTAGPSPIASPSASPSPSPTATGTFNISL